jgi:Mo-co oxidoreductase dimerisation domain
VKSVIVTPEPGTLLSASVKISGAAWSSGSPVTAVEVSTDGGQHWTPAKLGEDLGRYSWRLWEFPWTPRSQGEFTILARAKTAAGEVEPMKQEWNPGGYLWNVVPRVVVQVQSPQSYRRACYTCHDEHMMQQQHLTRAQWEKEVDKMMKWGAQVTPENRKAIVDYLAGKYKP